MLLLAAGFQSAGRADVATDGSFGAASGLSGPNFAIPASLGKKVGGNLFHSFAEFNLVNGQSATFSGPADVRNILSRVTGGTASSIDGILRSDIDGAHLYFINPSGVLFGANAKLEISGSFTVTTADYLRLGDGGRFDARLSTSDVLTSAPVSAFGFLSPAPAAVSFTGSTLDDAAGKSLTVIAGDVFFDGAAIVRTDRLLELVSVRSAGEVRVQTDPTQPLDAASFAKLGGVTLKNSSSLEAGRVVIRGGVLSLEKSAIAASGKRAGDRVDARLQREILLTDASAIRSTAAVSTPGQPALLLKAPTISVSGVSVVVSSPPDTESGARDIQIDAGDLEVSGGGQILARDAGNVDIHADRTRLLGTSGPDFFIHSRISTRGVNGPAGVVRLQVSGELTIRDGARIETESVATQKNGDIFVTAGAVSIIGPSDFSAMFTTTGILNSPGFGFDDSGLPFDGDAGSIHLDVAGRLSLADGGRISSETFGSGQVGSVFVKAGSLRIAGQEQSFFSGGISTNVEVPDNDGRTGEVRVDVSGDLEIVKGGQITSGSGARTPGGDISIRAKNMLIVGDGSGIKSFTGVNAQTFGSSRGGDVRLTISGNLTIAAAGKIVADTFRSGDSGGINLDVGKTLQVVDSGLVSALTRASSTGDGGSVMVKAHEVLVSSGGGISASTSGPGRGGDLGLEVVGGLRISDSGQVTASTAASGDGGNIKVNTGKLVVSTGGALSAKSTGAGAGGSIRATVPGVFRITDSGSVTASTSLSGQGGNVSIAAGDLFVSTGGKISAATARTGKGGSIRITAGNLTVSANGQISVATSGSGAGGSIEFSAANLALSTRGAISAQSTGSGRGGGIFGVVPGTLQITDSGLITASTSLSGRGGNVSLTVGDLLVSTYGQISAATSGSGAGGNIEFSADNLALSTRGAISAQTTGTGKGGGIRGTVPGTLQITDSGLITASTSLSGQGGNVSLDAGDLFISTGGKISAATAGTGEGGTINVNAGRIVISTGGSSDAALISAESTNTGDGGRGGDIAIDAGSLRIEGAPDFSTGISARSLGLGESGSVRLKLGTLSLDSSAFIGSSNTGAGKAGTVMVRADGDIFMRGGSAISTSAFQANAGDIDIASRTRIDLREGAAITASAGLNGGNITVAAPDFIHLIDSSITAIAGTTPSPVGGMGGNITIDPEFMVLDHSFIKADAAIGQGGNILLQAANFLSSETSITATGTTAGTVEIVAPELDLSAALVILPGGLVDPSTQLREQCARRLGLDFSSFLVIGRGGVSLAPDEPLAETGPTRKRHPAR